MNYRVEVYESRYGIAFINDTIASVFACYSFSFRAKSYADGKKLAVWKLFRPHTVTISFSHTENGSVSVTTKTMRIPHYKRRLSKKGVAGKKREERERAGRVVASAVTAVTAVILLYAGNKCAPLTHASAIGFAIWLHPLVPFLFLSLQLSSCLSFFDELPLSCFPCLSYAILRRHESYVEKKSGLHAISRHVLYTRRVYWKRGLIILIRIVFLQFVQSSNERRGDQV